MTYPRSIQLLAAAVSLATPLAMAALLMMPVNQTPVATRVAAQATLLVVVPALALWCHSVRKRVLLGEREVIDLPTRSKRTRIRWNDVEVVSHSAWWAHYVLLAGGGRRICVPSNLRGQSQFATQVLSKIRKDRIHCYELLQRAASTSSRAG